MLMSEATDRINRIIRKLSRGEPPGRIAEQEGVDMKTVANVARNYGEMIRGKAHEMGTDEAVERIMGIIRKDYKKEPDGASQPEDWKSGFAQLKPSVIPGSIYLMICNASVAVSQNCHKIMGEPERMAIGIDPERRRIAVWPDETGYRFVLRRINNQYLVRTLQEFAGTKDRKIEGVPNGDGVIFQL